MLKVDKKFYNSCCEYAVPDEWIEILFNYYVHGFPPGGFFTSWLANDMMSAVCHSHSSNTITAMKNTNLWIINEAPEAAKGSYEKVAAWLALTNEERRKICEDRRILRSMWDILKEKEPA